MNQHAIRYRAVACDVTSATLNRNVWQKRVAGSVNPSVTRNNMVRSCSAVGYANRDTKEYRARSIRFYRIPVNPEKRRLWLAAIRVVGKILILHQMQLFAAFISEVSACRNTNGIAVLR